MHEAILEKVAGRFDWRILAYCQMTNHFHAILQICERGLSDGMCLLNGCFAKYIHRRFRRRGHLFAERFWSGRIETQEHLVQGIAYVLDNPRRAYIVRDPVKWPWSTCQASVGLRNPPRYLDLSELLPLFGPTPAAARRALRGLLSTGHVPVPATGFELPQLAADDGEDLVALALH
jgi:putative transposase